MEKGSSSTAFVRGLVGPKSQAKCSLESVAETLTTNLKNVKIARGAKGNIVKILLPDAGRYLFLRGSALCAIP